MAGKRKKTEPILQESPSRFFKILLPSSLQDKKLRLPQMFVRKFGHELSAAATLITGNGGDWQVGLTKDRKNVWFRDGWHDFVEYHSIFAGYLLLFEYQRNSSFHVGIFDFTACEIAYPSKETFGSAPQVERNRQSIALGESTFEHELQLQIKKGEMEEMMDINEPNDDNEHDLLALLEEKGICTTVTCRRVLLAKGSEKVMNILQSYKPKKPCFMIVLQSVNKYFRPAYISSEFAEKCSINGGNSIKVQVSDEKEWRIRAFIMRRSAFRLTKGGTNF